MPNSLHTNKIKDEKDAFVNELFNMIPKREELISGEASAIATQIHKLYLTIYIMNYFKSQKLKTDYYEYLLTRACLKNKSCTKHIFPRPFS